MAATNPQIYYQSLKCSFISFDHSRCLFYTVENSTAPSHIEQQRSKHKWAANSVDTRMHAICAQKESLSMYTYVKNFQKIEDALAERLRRWFKVPVRKGVGSIPTGVIFSTPLEHVTLLTLCEKTIFSEIRCSIVVSISACHADDQGSIPCVGSYFTWNVYS